MRKGKNKQSTAKEILVVDESFTLSKKKGNGVIRRQVWQDSKGQITRYSLAYINFILYREDNGRVLGYDNAHGYHHKHYLGNIEPFNFTNFEELEELFQREFEVLYEQY